MNVNSEVVKMSLIGTGLVKVIFDNGYCFEEYPPQVTPGGGGLDILRFTPSVNEFSATHYDETGAFGHSPKPSLWRFLTLSLSTAMR